MSRNELQPAIDHARKRYFAKGGIAEDIRVDQVSDGYTIHLSYATRGYKEHIINELVSLGFNAILSTNGRMQIRRKQTTSESPGTTAE